MKVGIVTFHAATNYGAVLQAFALQTFLRQTGHSPFFIDHKHGRIPKGIRKYIGKTPGDTLRRVAHCRRTTVFTEFTRRYLSQSEQSYQNEEDLLSSPPDADAYISGSDQVWNPNFLKLHKDEQAFFLAFGSTQTLRISYAASLGVSNFPQNWEDRFAHHLKRFDYISVREKISISILKQLGRDDPVWVPDPTLLLPPESYERILKLSNNHNEHIFSYTLDREVPEAVKETKKIVSSFFSIKCVETYKRNPLHIICYGVPDPCRWLSLLKTSRFVVTNSYHGLLFSLIFKRPFIVLPLVGSSAGMNIRIESLLEKTGLTSRLVTKFNKNEIRDLCREPINWERVGKEIVSFAREGSIFLAQALNKRKS